MIKCIVRYRDAESKNKVDIKHVLYLARLPMNAMYIKLHDGSEWEIVQTCAQEFTFGDIKNLENTLRNALNDISFNSVISGSCDAMELAVLQWNWEALTSELDRYEDELLMKG